MGNFFFLLAFILSTAAFAEQYKYHPLSRLYLSAGHNPFFPTDAYQECIEHDGLERRNTNGSSDNLVTIRALYSKQDFYDLINFSSSMAGSYLFYSGSASVNLVDERAFHSDSFTWVILFKTTYGNQVLKNPRLKEKFLNYSHDDLYRACGSEIVTEETKGAMVYALITVSNLNSYRRKEFEGKLNVKASGTFWSANMEAHYKSILQAASSSTDFRVTIKAIGGEGISDLADIVGDEDFFKYSHIPQVLSSYIKNMSIENGVPLVFYTTKLKSFVSDMQNQYNNFKKRQVGIMFNRHESIKRTLRRLESILYGPESNRYELNSTKKLEYTKVYMQYLKSSNLIMEAAERCFILNDPVCRIPVVRLLPISWPAPIDDEYNFCENLRKQAVHLKIIDEDFYLMAKERNFAPVFDNSLMVSGWYPCEEVYDGQL